MVIPEEEHLSSMPCREFVRFRGSAVNIHSLFKLWLSNFFKVRLIVAYTMSGYFPNVLILGHSFVKRLFCDLHSGFDHRAQLDFNLANSFIYTVLAAAPFHN